MKTRTHDMTEEPDLRHSTGTGPTAKLRPVYQNLMPPCNHACPAGENIQAWMSLVHEKRYEEAWQTILADNPLPGVHGRVCYHPCETSCNRDQVDAAVSVHQVERFLGDMAIKENWSPRIIKAPSGKRVLIVGAGPSGLSAAYHLRRLGHEVEIRDAGPVAGGMLHFGIPAYRLPRQVLRDEIARIEKMGVVITLNHNVIDLELERRDGNFDAVFVAIGAHLSKKINIPAREAGKILDAVSFLRNVSLGEQPNIGRRVAIYGGGNTALDAARTAKRLGAEEALIIYRRDQDNMPAHPEELSDALDEGVKVNWLRTINAIDGETITVEKMELDENGRPQPSGEIEQLSADALILALGQQSDTQLLTNLPGIKFDKDGTVQVADNMMTGCPGVFAGGDMVPSERTVTVATGHGKKAANNIDQFIRGCITQQNNSAKPASKEIAHLEDLRIWFYSQAEQSKQPSAPLATRENNFEEVLGALTTQQAHYEASRCYSCGNCFECDGCFGACPEQAIIKLGTGKFYQIDYSKCTGCSACTLQCPTAAIHMTNNTV
jgi:NADPH-dependent glutamate synthase beta chain and related oxidoreductases